MDPILVDLGIVQIHWYSIFIFIAMVVGGAIVLWESNRFKLEENFTLNMFFWAIIFSFIGARLYFVAFNWDFYSKNLIDILKVWEGGLAIHGAMIMSLIFIIIYTKRYNIKTLYVLDMVVVGLIIGQAIGRWGNFFNTEAHGGVVAYETLKSFFIPKFIIEGMNIGGLYYHPTFLYESILCLIGFIVLLIVRRFKYIKAGQIFCLYFIWYGTGRFFIESLRTDSLMIGSLKAAQIVSMVMIGFGVLFFIIFGRGSKFSNQYNNTTNIKVQDNTNILQRPGGSQINI